MARALFLRLRKPGAGVIVCRPGAAEIAAARARGCRVVEHDDPREALWRLARARWRTDKLNLKILGVTGTNGKTTSSLSAGAFVLQRQGTRSA